MLRHGAWGGCRRGAPHGTGALDDGGPDRRWWSAISPFTHSSARSRATSRATSLASIDSVATSPAGRRRGGGSPGGADPRGGGKGRTRARHGGIVLVSLCRSGVVSRPGPSRRVSGRVGRGGRGEAGSGAVWRAAVELKELRQQEPHTLRSSTLFLDRKGGTVCRVRHRSAHSAIRVAGSEVRCGSGRRKGDGGCPMWRRAPRRRDG